MSFSEFLDLVKVLRMLFGRDIADQYFTKNIDLYYNLNYNANSVSIHSQTEIR